jgi:hypothetical protein
MFTLVCFSASQDTSGVLTTTAAVADPHVRVSGNDISVPVDLANVAAVYAIGANMTRAALVSPSIRRRYPFEVFPIDAASTPSDPWRLHSAGDAVIQLDPDESLNFQFAESAAGAGRGTGLVWLSDGPIMPDTSGEFFTIRATGSTTLTAFTWTNCALTFNDTLPAGTYDIVGMHCISTGAIAARLVIPQFAYRPGVICSTSVNVFSGTTFRFGNYGVFGTFSHMTPPTVDFLSSSADTSQTVYLDLRMTSGRLSGPGRM